MQVNFTLMRVADGTEDRFCNEGVDIQGNITLEVFYRVRDAANVVGAWEYQQTLSLGKFRHPARCALLAASYSNVQDSQCERKRVHVVWY